MVDVVDVSKSRRRLILNVMYLYRHCTGSRLKSLKRSQNKLLNSSAKRAKKEVKKISLKSKKRSQMSFDLYFDEHK